VSAPHLLPAAALGGLLYARPVERRAVHAMATRPDPRLERLQAPQVEAFRHRHLLPLYLQDHWVTVRYIREHLPAADRGTRPAEKGR